MMLALATLVRLRGTCGLRGVHNGDLRGSILNVAAHVQHGQEQRAKDDDLALIKYYSLVGACSPMPKTHLQPGLTGPT